MVSAPKTYDLCMVWRVVRRADLEGNGFAIGDAKRIGIAEHGFIRGIQGQLAAALSGIGFIILVED